MGDEPDHQIGIELTGLRAEHLRRPDAPAQCQALLERHGVVVYREVEIPDDDLVAFGSAMGTLVRQPTGEHTRPEIQVITVDPEFANPVMVAYRRGNFFWHIDGTSDAVPQVATFLAAREIADADEGDTEFASLVAAYDALSTADKDLIDGLFVVHSFAHAQGVANPDAPNDQREAWKRVPERVHPLVWRYPDGRRSFIVGTTARAVVGMDEDASRALLDRLQAHATQPQFVMRHSWRVGDLVVWDNTAMLHRALDFAPTSRRRMHRITLAGAQ